VTLSPIAPEPEGSVSPELCIRLRMSGSGIVLIDEILSPNRRAIFARCLDFQLRFVPQVIAGLPHPSDAISLLGEPPSRSAMQVLWIQGERQFPKSE